ncbi:MAG: trypsin-like peptidase domain-containing protein [bacterium]
MTLELRILTGARAGVVQRFEDKTDVAIGRHAMSDLRFDPQGDLDVSTRHAELRAAGDGWVVADLASTNGTFVNGKRLMEERRLVDGDILSFGLNGPRVEVRGVGTGGGAAPATELRSSMSTPVSTLRKDTGVRVAEAVHAQTKSMKRTFAITVGTLVAAGAIGFFFWQRQNAAHDQILMALVARGESTTVALQTQLAASGSADSARRAQLEQQIAANKQDVAAARDMAAGRGKGNVELLSQQMARMQAATQFDRSKVRDANDAAVAMIASDFDGKFIAGTAFSIAPNGLMVTNRHVVRSEGGLVAKRIVVIFANTTNKWLPAHIVRVDEVNDLALLQIDVPGKYPSVTGVSRAGGLARVGAPLLTIGFPGANETAMEGSGMNITARTSTLAAMVSKRIDDVLQLDTYSGHGASGSPVFDADGNVVGVIYGGAAESGGRIVYAVPAQRLAAFLGGEGGGIIR